MDGQITSPLWNTLPVDLRGNVIRALEKTGGDIVCNNQGTIFRHSLSDRGVFGRVWDAATGHHALHIELRDAKNGVRMDVHLPGHRSVWLIATDEITCVVKGETRPLKFTIDRDSNDQRISPNATLQFQRFFQRSCPRHVELSGSGTPPQPLTRHIKRLFSQRPARADAKGYTVTVLNPA